MATQEKRNATEEGRGVVVWVGWWVRVGAYVCVVCVVCADSLRSVPQDKNGAQKLHQVKRMIGGLWNVLFSTCSQTLNG